MPTERNENIRLKCLWIGESASSKETLAYAEGLSSLNCLLSEDKAGCKLNGECQESVWFF